MGTKALEWIVALVILLSLLTAFSLAFLRTYEYTPPPRIAGQAGHRHCASGRC